MSQTEVVAEAVEHEDELAHHPEPRKYVFIGIVLAIITAIEVGIFYIDMPTALFVGALLILSLMKFSLVVAWFMHLRFDNKVFRYLFITGLGFALFVFTIVLVIFTGNDGPAPTITGG